MSFLNLPNGIPNFSKAVISLWFRAPKESVIAASSSAIDAGMPGFFMLQGILPLITFGKPQNAKVYLTPTHNIGVIHPNPIDPLEPDPSTTYDVIYYQEGGSYQVDPSFIGLLCNPDGTMRLVFNLQMADSMITSATTFETTHADIYSGVDPGAPIVVLGNGVIQLGENVAVTAIRDVSYVDNNKPEFFYVDTGYDRNLAPDKWHHLLLSFDVSGTVSIGTPFASSECRLWYAIDDVDYRGADYLQPYRDSGDLLDSNAILTKNVYELSGIDSLYYSNHYVGLPSGSFSGGSIPSDGAGLGLPASTSYTDAVFNVMMAELQIFTGLTIDTGVEAMRRAFLDAEGLPVKPKATEEMLGQRPVVLLHGTRNWRAGKNTGLLGIERNTAGEDVIIPAGQFAHIGRIDPFKPDPSIIPAS